MAQFFNGKFLIQPQASVAVDTTKLANLNPTAPNDLGMVGPCTAGIPQQAVLLTSPAQARRVLRSGDLLDAVLLAFDPSSDTGGASRIQVVRVNSAIQSRIKVLDLASPVKASGTVTIAGTPAGGNTITATINGAAVSYVLQVGDTTATLAAAGLVAAINNSANTIVNDALAGVSATSVAGVITISAKVAGVDGNSITLTASAAGGGATAVAGGATLTGGTGNTLITLQSLDYGLYTNQIYYKAVAGSTIGTKFTVGLTSVGNVLGGEYTVDNIARSLITVQYTGGGSACTLSVNDTVLTTTVTGAVQDNVSISFASFTTVQAVVDYLNSTGVYVATVAVSASAILNTTAQFDPLTSVDIKTSVRTLSANLAALLDVLNSNANIFCTATRKASPAGSTPGYPSGALYFSGGSDGTTTATDWANAFTALQRVDVNIISAVTDAASIHAAALAHCSFMSGQSKYRVAILGGALGEYSPSGVVPVQTIINRAIPLNSERVVLVSPGISYFDINGNLVSKSSAFSAAAVAGMLAAVAPGEPLTHKSMSNIVSLETNFTPGDVDTLLLNGVLPIEFVTGKGFRIVQSLTTWLGAKNFAKNEISTVLAIDEVSRRVQEALDSQIVGKKLTPETLAQCNSIADTVLRKCWDDRLIVGDAPSFTAGSPAYKNIQSETAGGDTIRVSFQASPAIPANYVLVSISAVAYQGKAGNVA